MSVRESLLASIGLMGLANRRVCKARRISRFCKVAARENCPDYFLGIP